MTFKTPKHFPWFLINSFQATGLTLYPLKICFQGVQEDTKGMKWVKKILRTTVTIIN